MHTDIEPVRAGYPGDARGSKFHWGKLRHNSSDHLSRTVSSSIVLSSLWLMKAASEKWLSLQGCPCLLSDMLSGFCFANHLEDLTVKKLLLNLARQPDAISRVRILGKGGLIKPEH